MMVLRTHSVAGLMKLLRDQAKDTGRAMVGDTGHKRRALVAGCHESAEYGTSVDKEPSATTVSERLSPMRTTVLISAWAPGLVARLGAEAVLYDWGGGLVWVRTAPGTDLRTRLGAFEGHATLIRAEAAVTPVFQPQPAPLAALAAGLRARFDPRGILNPGLMG